MGRKKIVIKPIESAASRRATFEKRRIGLLKKAMELSILCESTISVTIERRIEGDLQIYSSEPFDEIIDRYQNFEGTYRLLTNDHIDEMIPGKMTSNQVGYQVRKQSSSSQQFGANDVNDHYQFQRQQLNPSTMISNMEIIPTIPSPSLGNLYSQLQRDNITSPHHPSFNGYQPAYNQSFGFMTNDILPPMPSNFNNQTKKKRSFQDINNGDNDPFISQPPMKKFKIENGNKSKSNNSSSNTNDTSHTSTIDIDGIEWSQEVTPPIVQPLELQIKTD